MQLRPGCCARRPSGSLLYVLLLASTWTASAHSEDETHRTSLRRSAPEGFEDLAAARHLQLPIILNKVRIGQAEASVDLQSITFDDPAAVTALVTNVSDRKQVLAALSGPLPLNAELLCNEYATTGCGQLQPLVAGVIYDGANEEVLLFVNPALRVASVERLRPQDSEPALLGRFNANLSGQRGDGAPVYSVGASAVAGFGATHLRTQALVRNGHSEVDQLYVRHIRDGLEQTVGLFNTGFGAFLPPERLLGARAGTTLEDLPPDAGAYDVPLTLLLASPAIVDAFSGTQLLGSARYQAGEVRIDTSNFPSGAYLVRLRILEAGVERFEERFFARGSAFPPLGAPQTLLMFGARSSGGTPQPSIEDDALAWHLSHRRRLSQRYGFGSALHVRENAAAAELELALSIPNLQWSTSILGSSAAEFACATSMRMQAGSWRWFGDLRRMLVPQGSRAFDTRRFLGVRQNFWQASLTTSRTFGSTQLQTIALWRRAANGRGSWSVQPVVDLPLRIGGRRVGLRLAGDLGPDRRVVRIEFAVPAWNQSIAARTGLQFQQDSTHARTTPLYEAEIGEQWRLGPEVDLHGELQWQQEERRSITGSAQLSTSKGFAAATLQSDLDSGQRSYFGNAQGGFAWTRQGFTLTPAVSGEAAVVYVNNSAPDRGAADALLSNSRVGIVQPQQTRVQPVSAFRRSAVGILPSRGAALGGSSPNREATLFPGTVAIVAADFVHVTAAFGRLIDVAGAPVARASLSGAQGDGATDADGYFQIDIAALAKISAHGANGTTCEFELTPPPQDVAIFDAGELVCQ